MPIIPLDGHPQTSFRQNGEGILAREIVADVGYWYALWQPCQNHLHRVCIVEEARSIHLQRIAPQGHKGASNRQVDRFSNVADYYW
jgi:hypothetical protein